ncbi:caspase family protein [Euryhalocaulis caribicus]|uniref:caspase family protein n=1 Tax=Euryhalocaulis caribicus TaxID=1161401 RepID=UPI0003B71508|nr:caspase family protein [Euryhalocaulis caribicus]
MTDARFEGHAIIASFADDLASQVRADGDAVAAILTDPQRCAYPPSNVVRLSGMEATPRNLVDAIDALSELPQDKPVLLYFSGHGYQDAARAETGLLLADPDNPTSSLPWSSKVFGQVWSSLPARRKLVMVDSCNSGGTPAVKEKGRATVVPVRTSPNPAALGGGNGSAVIASSASDQASVILPGDHLSLFTKFLVAGLRGGAGHDAKGYVTLFDLFNFVRANVVSVHPGQTPVLSTNRIDDDFRLAYCPDESARRPEWRLTDDNAQTVSGLRDVLSALYPLGPRQDSIWERSGGELSQIDLVGTGSSQWWAALRKLERGGGGKSISFERLLDEIMVDYPRNRDILSLRHE